ncbi:tetratricopeptide repeat protein [Porphyrobacter sp. AAP82]|uniref:tetratricopeptide repeat protein n=1 Tax=Porphyrobacter sp. AAP82 TaxID=1248917 RepID=UPI0002E42AC9|nr:tetratricopeptide repeat protein [Porphyrobacter sp. AAP82]
MSVAFLALALAAANPLPGAPSGAAQLAPDAAPELAARTIAAGRAEQAIPALQKASAADPQDAAVLINLGIAYAQTGDEVRAREAFRQALAYEEVIELDTADGTATDSRRLARKALKMLDRGEFRSAGAVTGQLSLRDQ